MFRRRKRVVIWLTMHSGIKIVMSAILVALMLFMLTYELPSTKTWTYWTMPLSGKIIALDAGHGGPDGGARSKDGLDEKDVNLAIAKYLRDYLQQAGALVVMTREDDRDLADPSTRGYSRRKTEDLLKRAEFISQSKTDLFLSIHLNSIPSAKWSGAQTFFYPNHRDNAALAALIQDEMKKNLKNTDRVAKQADKEIYLLKTLQMPSALVEVGFLSNPAEAALLRDPAYQKKVAAAIYQGILRYYSGEKVGSD
ncbi:MULTISPECIES: N-acetylmuramoyl-L-alanine amidase CwlD [Paenibacillus]|uniref:N-acetylmuramoyl-L-alanine amidase n=1 Tax=Paenibacillus naphthalenovorans TaxID=162209 RepID=A0A0U2M911_9BACL|nr:MULTISPECIES: N-acetylmuramoyl-L-alanine amidase CwlD [Paenibacillus]ALS24896.1 N-acetylmuramoyl-L-alanine amidase [Paenibacillus naphthalenovorans]NTZ19788.1 N-acetylmuramoyl-L-alanine amidase CwlD [Paenibacillus sp. JMULE4]GCL74454.1 N-acetylmuramoyl-L-alanine amidase CwlD [Paenibacillus naphthalenovorans]SDJ50463.1 N-acetylmuramoyl-L-alanine amidase [Paenibacillus naphthalenovorans]